jgi:hypothetical protein
MDPNNLFAKYKDQIAFKITIGILAVLMVIKIAMLGYGFGQWLK